MNKWYEPSNVIAGTAVILSVIALGSSVRSCSVSERALAVAEAEYLDARALVLLGTVVEDHIDLRPIDDSFLIQSVQFKFPKEFGGASRPAVPPSFQINVPSELNVLKRIIEENYSVEPGMALASLQSGVPVLVETRAIAKGRATFDRSLYVLVYSFVLMAGQPGNVEVKLLSFQLEDRLSDDRNGEAELESAWAQIKENARNAKVVR
jgi:hypothetical protein